MCKYYAVLKIYELCIGWVDFWASDNLYDKFDSAKLIPSLSDLFAVSGFELHDIIEIGCSHHVLCSLVIILQQFVLFDFTLRNKSWNHLTLADLVLPRKRGQLTNSTDAVTSCDELAKR